MELDCCRFGVLKLECYRDGVLWSWTVVDLVC